MQHLIGQVAVMEFSPATAASTLAEVGSVRLKVRRDEQPALWQEYPGLSVFAATQLARRDGLAVLESQVSANSYLPSSGAGILKSSARRRFDLLVFSQELLTLLQAGLNLGEALNALLAKSRPGAERNTLERVVNPLRQGRAFSDVLGDQPLEFPPVYIATMRASERTGNLSRALERYIAYQQQFDVMRRKLIAAAIYPTLLLVVGGLVTLFLLGFVVPRFAAIYESSGRQMPLASRALLWIGTSIHNNAVLVVIAAAVIVWATVSAARSDAIRARVVNFLCALPFIRTQATLFRLTRFYRALGLLLGSGIALPRALGMVSGLLGSAQQVSLTTARLQLEQGKSVSQTLVDNGLASTIAESLIRVGERSGELAGMLERAAHFHDEELGRWIDAVSRLLEPVLMLFIGLIIGLVVVLMYMPLFDLVGTLG